MEFERLTGSEKAGIRLRSYRFPPPEPREG